MATQILMKLKESRYALQGAQQEFREQQAQDCRQHKYQVGNSVPLSTQNVQLAGMPGRKLAQRFVGPFVIQEYEGSC